MTTLSQAMPGGAVTTDDPCDLGWPELPLVGVARSHAAGLLAAQRFAADVASHPRIRLLGLIVVADAPGRLPGVLETTLRLVEGGYPRVWRAAWVEGWRRGEPITPRSVPRSFRVILTELMERTGMSGTSSVPDTNVDGAGGTDRTDMKEMSA